MVLVPAVHVLRVLADGVQGGQVKLLRVLQDPVDDHLQWIRNFDVLAGRECDVDVIVISEPASTVITKPRLPSPRFRRSQKFRELKFVPSRVCWELEMVVS